MPNVLSLKQQASELNREVQERRKSFEDGSITGAQLNEFMDKAEKQDQEISAGIKAYNRANAYRAPAEAEAENDGQPPILGAPSPRQKQAQVNWEQYKQMQKMAQANLHNKGSGRGNFSFDIEMKTQGVTNLMGAQTSGTSAPATGDLAVGTYFQAGTAGAAVEPEFIPGISELRFYPNVISSLFPSFPVSSPIASYVKENLFTPGAAGVPEGATKPTGVSGIKRYSEQVGKIAVLRRVTDELIQDAPYFWALIQRRGVMDVTRKEEVELLAGAGMPGVNGLLNRSPSGDSLSYPTGFTTAASISPVSITVGGATGSGSSSETVASVTPGRSADVGTASSAGTNMAEAILNGVTDIRVNTFFEPDAVVLNPQDWTTIRLSKDSTGNYLGGSFFGTSYGIREDGGPTGIEANLELWGKRVVSTPVMPAGLLLVGDFADAGQVLRLGGLRVDVTNLNGNDFEQNLWTMRIEERVGLLVDRPNLFELIVTTGGS